MVKPTISGKIADRGFLRPLLIALPASTRAPEAAYRRSYDSRREPPMLAYFESVSELSRHSRVAREKITCVSVKEPPTHLGQLPSKFLARVAVGNRLDHR